MNKVDEYLQRAKVLRARAANYSGSVKTELESLASQWERLAQLRLSILEGRPNR